jgi:hypothetical protein
MQPDIVAGAVFPGYEWYDHTAKCLERSLLAGIFLFTSAGVCVFCTLASRFLAAERVVGMPTSVRQHAAEAVDAGIVFDRYLLIVMPGEVLRFDLDPFRATRVKGLLRDFGWDSEPTHLMPAWESEELEAHSPLLEWR